MSWDTATSLSTIILTVFGLLVAVFPKWVTKGWLKWAAVVVFIALGVFSFFANDLAKQAADAKADARYIEGRRLTDGGDNFPYFLPILNELPPADGLYRLRMATDKYGPLYNVQFHIHPLNTRGDAKDPSYWGIPLGMADFVYPWGMATSHALGFGDWRIEIDARNGHWVQELRMSQRDEWIDVATKVIGPNGATLLDLKTSTPRAKASK